MCVTMDSVCVCVCVCVYGNLVPAFAHRLPLASIVLCFGTSPFFFCVRRHVCVCVFVCVFVCVACSCCKKRSCEWESVLIHLQTNLIPCSLTPHLLSTHHYLSSEFLLA